MMLVHHVQQVCIQFDLMHRMIMSTAKKLQLLYIHRQHGLQAVEWLQSERWCTFHSQHVDVRPSLASR